NGVLVRPAAPEDADAIAKLYPELGPKDAGICVLRSRIEEMREDARTLLLVAESGGRLSGTATLNLCLDAMYRTQPYGLIENLVVSANARRGGVGKAMMC